jgi:hypothetical protein
MLSILFNLLLVSGLMVTGCWLMGACCWLLVAGYWVLVTGISDFGFRIAESEFGYFYRLQFTYH